MGLFAFLRSLLGGAPAGNATQTTLSPPLNEPAPPSNPAAAPPPTLTATAVAEPTSARAKRFAHDPPRPRTRVVLQPLHYQSSLIPTPPSRELVDDRPYRFAFPVARGGQFLDLSLDSDQRWLDYFGLPPLKTPDDLANWLNIPIGKLAWLTHRTTRGHRPQTSEQSHYIERWIPKRSRGWRLLEAPKPLLKQVQRQILREILDKVPAHAAAHGFVAGRSIITNAHPHLGQRFILKFDLANFYTTVRYSRVVAIFRSLGYSREAAIWLARLTTSAIPWNATLPGPRYDLQQFTAPHLPQGASTSPALANLSAFNLDIRLTGLAAAYGLVYTRYADDLTFSGPGLAIPALHEVIPLIRKIVVSERFHLNANKCRVLRNCQQQTVAGVVVNQRLNVSRHDYDRLKAILHNCVKHGPSQQNRDQHADFASHLQGRIAFVRQLNPQRGEKLLAIYRQIDWRK